jgi:hypothetical protein
MELDNNGTVQFIDKNGNVINTDGAPPPGSVTGAATAIYSGEFTVRGGNGRTQNMRGGTDGGRPVGRDARPVQVEQITGNDQFSNMYTK